MGEHKYTKCHLVVGGKEFEIKPSYLPDFSSDDEKLFAREFNCKPIETISDETNGKTLKFVKEKIHNGFENIDISKFSWLDEINAKAFLISIGEKMEKDTLDLDITSDTGKVIRNKVIYNPNANFDDLALVKMRGEGFSIMGNRVCNDVFLSILYSEQRDQKDNAPKIIKEHLSEYDERISTIGDLVFGACWDNGTEESLLDRAEFFAFLPYKIEFIKRQ